MLQKKTNLDPFMLLCTRPQPRFTKAFPAGNLINGKTLLQGMGEGRLALSYLKRKVSVKYETYWGSRF